MKKKNGRRLKPGKNPNNGDSHKNQDRQGEFTLQIIRNNETDISSI